MVENPEFMAEYTHLVNPSPRHSWYLGHPQKVLSIESNLIPIRRFDQLNESLHTVPNISSINMHG